MLVYSQLEVPENSTTGMNRGFGGMKSAPYFLSKLVVFLSFEICQFHFNQTLENKYRNFLEANKKAVFDKFLRACFF